MGQIPSDGGTTTVLIRMLESLVLRIRRRELLTLRDLIAPDPRFRLLDVGGGAGAATHRYAQGCDRVILLEPNRRKVDFGRKRRRGIDFLRARGEDIPLRDNSFDRAVAAFSFHHVADADETLKEIHRVLKPSGRFLLVEIQPRKHPGSGTHTEERRKDGSRPHLYEPEALKRILVSHGFRGIMLHPGDRKYFASATK